MAPLPPRDQRYIWLRYQVEGYTEEIVHDFEQRLETIFGRQVNRVYILDFEGSTPDMRHDLAERMRMVYTRDDGQEMGGARRSMTWRQFILALGLHTAEEMAEDEFGAYWLGSERLIPDKGDLSDYWVKISSGRDFLRGAPSYTYIRDPVRRLMDRGAANVPYLLAQYLFRHAKGRKSGARLSRGHFIGRLAYHFGLVSDDGLRGLSVMACELSLIDMGELAVEAGAPESAEDAPVVVEGDQAVPAPVQAPQQPPPPPLVTTRTIPLRLGRLEEEVIKPGSKFSTIVHEYVTEPSKILTPKCKMEKRETISSVWKLKKGPWKKRISTNIGGEFTNLEDLEVLES
ncbi:hypothetical protein Tco_1012248, partial [Tanacetum coccineum]